MRGGSESSKGVILGQSLTPGRVKGYNSRSFNQLTGLKARRDANPPIPR